MVPVQVNQGATAPAKEYNTMQTHTVNIADDTNTQTQHQEIQHSYNEYNQSYQSESIRRTPEIEGSTA